MAVDQQINVGTVADDDTGDTLRAAGIKYNAHTHTELAPLASPSFTGLLEFDAAKGIVATKSTGYTVAASESGQLHVVTSAITVTVPAVSTLCPNSGDCFHLNVYADGVAVTIDGPGATNVSMVAGDIVTLQAWNGGKIVAAKGAATVIS